MRQVLICRRTFIALVSIGSLVGIALYNHSDVAMAISSIAIALGVSNATESALRSKFENAPKE